MYKHAMKKPRGEFDPVPGRSPEYHGENEQHRGWASGIDNGPASHHGRRQYDPWPEDPELQEARDEQQKLMQQLKREETFRRAGSTPERDKIAPTPPPAGLKKWWEM